MVDISNLQIVVELLDQQFREAIEDLKDELGELQRRINRLDGQTISLKADLDWRREFAALQRQIAATERQDIDLDVDIDTTELVAAMAAMQGGGRAGGPAMGRGTISRGFATGNLRDFNISMADLHNVVARFIPVLLNFVMAIPAAVTALLTLATAAAAAAAAMFALTGLAFLGAAMQEADGGMPSLQELADTLARIRDVLFEGIAPLAARFAGLYDQFLDGLSALLTQISRQGAVLAMLADDFGRFGQFLIETIPTALRQLGILVAQFNPVFAAIGQFMRSIDILELFSDATLDALPALEQFTRALIALLPGLIDASVGFLRVSAAIMEAFQGFTAMLSILPVSAEALAVFVGLLLTAATAVFLLNSALIQAAVSGAMQLGTAILSLLPSMSSLIGANATATLSALGLAGAIRLVTAAIIGLLAVTGIGLLIAVVGSLAAEWALTANNISDATKNLKDFNDLNRQVAGGPNPYPAPPSGTGTATGQRAIQNNVSVQTTGNREVDSARTKNVLWRLNKVGGM